MGRNANDSGCGRCDGTGWADGVGRTRAATIAIFEAGGGLPPCNCVAGERQASWLRALRSGDVIVGVAGGPGRRVKPPGPRAVDGRQLS
jgi:hypothetical protein